MMKNTILYILMFITSTVFSYEIPDFDLELYNESYQLEDGFYTVKEFSEAFPKLHGFREGELERAYIEDESLRITLLANKAASASGVVCNTVLDSTREVISMEYKIKFQEDFDWSKGGKLPGVSGGNGYTGGTPATDGKGWSVRLMWRENGTVIPYIYHYNQPKKYGDDFGHTIIGNFEKGKWHTIKIFVKVNTEANSDGVVIIWIDGEEAFAKYDLCYATEDMKHNVNMIRWAFFRGGSNPDWWADEDQYIYIDDVKVYTKE